MPRGPLELLIIYGRLWAGAGTYTLQAPTVLLFDKDGKFHSFGYEAEKAYSRLAYRNQHEGWQCFRRFKMELNKTIRPTTDMVLVDDQGHTKPALEVFSAAIGYLKKDLMDTLYRRLGGHIKDSNIDWILTVPAIWNDGAKQFMTEAATKAGIPEDRLALALEPECAAMYCKETAVYNQSTQMAEITKFTPGSQYMIVDMGGETVDITAHEIDSNRNLKELYPPTGGPWGGIMVDEAFDSLLEKLFTSDVMQTFNLMYKEDELDLHRTFESKKRVRIKSKAVSMRFPSRLSDLLKEEKNETFESSLRKSQFADELSVRVDKVMFAKVLFAGFFKNSIENILKHLRELLAKPELVGIETLMLVGGFAESERVQYAITNEFSKKRVLTPDDAGLSIVKGAVMIGLTSSKVNLFRQNRKTHNPDSTYRIYTCISSRRLPYTYGIAAAIPFDKQFHPLEKKIVQYGNEMCVDIFKVFITRGTDVVPAESVVRHTIYSPYGGAARIPLEIFRSTEMDPRFTTDDGCTRVGKLVLQLSSKRRDEIGVIDVKMLFGDTQLKVEACQHGRPDVAFAAEFDFLATSPATALHMVVAAIDFGTTYSGYAYALKSDFEKGKILANHNWTGEGIVTDKAPTVVLFDKEGKFHSFGYEAEQAYSELADENLHKGWQYFRRFKMELNKTIRPTRDMVLLDDQGHTKPALEVFSAAIGYLKKDLMDTLHSRLGGHIKDSDIDWILTVPAIWNDGAKQFMAEAATKTGIPQDRLALALEPECAAIFCKETAVYNQCTQMAEITKFAPGSQYMIVDMGGGTVDITAHEIDSNQNLKELYPPTGGPWGGMLVDEAFDSLLEKLFTLDVMQAFKSKYTEDDMSLHGQFELKKREMNTSTTSNHVKMKFPVALTGTFKEKQNEPFESWLQKSEFANELSGRVDKFLFAKKFFAGFFNNSIENILKHLRELLAKPELVGIETLMLVGGFAESKRVKRAITDEFSKKRVITPDDAGLSIVKGAVMFGFNSSKFNLVRQKRKTHNPDSTYHMNTCVSSRKLPYTYGIATIIPFDKRFHPLEKKIVQYGNEMCVDIFNVFITRGTDVVPGESVVRHTFDSFYKGAAKVSVAIFRSTKICPRFTTDDDCTRVGELVLQLSLKKRDDIGVIDVKMLFGDTQLEVEACQHGQPHVALTAEFDFLS